MLKPFDLQALSIFFCIKVALVTEPAMGSAAFLNEAVSQLAEAYLERKQKETGVSIPHEQRQQELQKVKMKVLRYMQLIKIESIRNAAEAEQGKKKKCTGGIYHGQIHIADDFDATLSDFCF